MKNESKEVTALTVVETPPVPPQENKMTIADYEDKYVRYENVRSLRVLTSFVVGIVGVFLFGFLAMIALRVSEMNEYAGIATAVVGAILFTVFFIIPVVKILRSDAFLTNVNAQTSRKAQKHNRALRKKIAEQIVDFNNKVGNAGWYEGSAVTTLEKALSSGDDKALKNGLTALYKGSVKKAAKNLIMTSSVRAGLYTALSQDSKLDAALIAVVDIQLIKDLVFLYGFRPTDAQLASIMSNVLVNALAAFGLQSVNPGKTITSIISKFSEKITLVGPIISTVIDSTVQGLTNATLTAVIGYRTIAYLQKDYDLQNVLDEVVFDDSDYAATCEEIKTELRVAQKNKPNEQKK